MNFPFEMSNSGFKASNLALFSAALIGAAYYAKNLSNNFMQSNVEGSEEDGGVENREMKCDDESSHIFDEHRIYDCIIVGAGISGLSTAADLITEHSIDRKNILIIDAQSYIGGRIKQADDFIPGLHVDCGAEIKHGSETILNEIAKDTMLHTKRTFVWATHLAAL